MSEITIGRNRPLTAAAVPVLQFLNGHGQIRWRNAGDKTWKNGLAGFIIECERYADFGIDEVCADLFPTVEVQHSSNRSKPEIVRHWYLGEQVTLYPITSGPPALPVAVAVRHGYQTAAAGIGLRWRRGGTSLLAVRVYEQRLTEAGWCQPLQVQASSTQTDYLLAALAAHAEVSFVADDLVRAKGGRGEVQLYEMGWPLAASEEQVAVGQGAQTAYIRTIVCTHPKSLDPKKEDDYQYLQACYLKRSTAKTHHPLGEAIRARIAEDWRNTRFWAEDFRKVADAAQDAEADAAQDAEADAA